MIATPTAVFIMTLLYSDPVYLEHDTGHHPECAERLRQITIQLQADGLDKQCTPMPCLQISSKRLAFVHPPEYSQFIEDFCRRGGGRIESDTMVSAQSYRVALQATGAAVDAVSRVIHDHDPRALCLVRPPGHHALQTSAMGFCLLNHIAIAARVATIEFDIDRVLIVDWDVHHGNGTQAIFWEDEQVGYFSIHRWPFYPGTGAADETGAGSAIGTVLNLPTTIGTSRRKYLDNFSISLEKFAAHIRPQLVLISAGFDSHHLDPIGSLGLEAEDFMVLTKKVKQIADEYAEGKLVSVLEGGYHTQALAECVAVHLQELLLG